MPRYFSSVNERVSTLRVCEPLGTPQISTINGLGKEREEEEIGRIKKNGRGTLVAINSTAAFPGGVPLTLSPG